MRVQVVLQLSRDGKRGEAVFHLLKIVYKLCPVIKYSSYVCKESFYSLLDLADNWKADGLSAA